MKKLLILILFSSFLFGKSVGILSLVIGKAEITRGGNIINATTGANIDEKDILNTKKSGRLQITFKDKTVITLGKSSEFKIEEFSQDSKKPKMSLFIKRGTFKAITGAIGKVAPKKFKLKSKTSTIGIRGTYFTGEITEEKDSLFCTKGAITVMSNAAGLPIVVNEGEFTTVKPAALPARPKAFTASDLKKVSKSTSLKQGAKSQQSRPTSSTSNTSNQTSSTPATTTSTQSTVSTQNQNQISTVSFSPETIASESVQEQVASTSYEQALNTSNAYFKGYILGKNSSGTLDDTTLSISKGTGTTANDSYSKTYTKNSLTGSFTLNSKTFNLGSTAINDSKSKYYGDDIFSASVTTSSGGSGLLESKFTTSDYQAGTYNNNDYVSWGYWRYGSTTDSNSETSFSSITDEGYFVVGEETPSSVIDSLKTAGGSPVYYMGTALYNDNQTGSVDLSFDFGSSTPISGTIAGHSLSAGGAITSNAFSHADGVKGTFYGPNANSIGGVFNFDNGTTYGVFTGAKH